MASSGENGIQCRITNDYCCSLDNFLWCNSSIITGSVTVSVITGISGIIIKVISKLLFPISKEANDRLDRLDKTRSAMRVIAGISDPAKRETKP
ncbi:MAG: TRADD-N-associated membrane domain-containing protein [Candidatus Brocadia sp.]